MKNTKKVIITGGATGIGRACTKIFLQHGWQVFVLSRSEGKLKKLKADIQVDHSPASSAAAQPTTNVDTQLILVPCDLTQDQLVDQQIAKWNQEGIIFDALINNAGIYIRNTPEKPNPQAWRDNFATNLFGSVNFTEKLFPLMQKPGFSIVNVSSTLALRPIPGTSAYSASKAAMNSWASALALEWGSYGIRVNSVTPGIIDTPIHDFHTLDEDEKNATLKAMGPMQPLGRIGSPANVAEAVHFLASEASGWTTGAVLSVDGGINLGSK